MIGLRRSSRSLCAPVIFTEDQVEPDPQAAAGGEGCFGRSGYDPSVSGRGSEPRGPQTRRQGANPPEQSGHHRKGTQVSHH